MEKIIKSREFLREVEKLAQQYNLPFFIVTDEASMCKNNGNDAIKNARESHMRWECENGINPHHDWK
jgi:hypothetical protein